MVDYDVIVVGGGIAGVTAARDLTHRGQKCILLEAQDRLGGRLYTIPVDGHPVELGGTWIHWCQPCVWAEKERYGLEIVDTPGCTPERFFVMTAQGPSELAEESLGEFVGGFEKFFAESKECWERPYDSSFSRAKLVERDISVADRFASLDLTPLQAATVGGLLEILSMCNPNQASYVEMMRCFSLCGWNFPIFNDTGARYKLKDGNAALVNAIATDGGFETALNTKVNAVKQTADSVSVELAGGKVLNAKSVVVTVPLNVLDNLSFDPPIAEIKMQACAEKHAGGGSKVFLHVEGDPGSLMFLSRTADCPMIGSFTYYREATGSLMVAFSHDPKALEKSVEEWQAIYDSFSSGVVKVLKTFGHNWGTDEMAKGSWGNFKAGQFSRFAEDLPKHEGRVFFASADTTEGWRGFIEGAIQAGAKTAQDVLKAHGK